jgi:hypothetical protein
MARPWLRLHFCLILGACLTACDAEQSSSTSWEDVKPMEANPDIIQALIRDDVSAPARPNPNARFVLEAAESVGGGRGRSVHKRATYLDAQTGCSFRLTYRSDQNEKKALPALPGAPDADANAFAARWPDASQTFSNGPSLEALGSRCVAVATRPDLIRARAASDPQLALGRALAEASPDIEQALAQSPGAVSKARFVVTSKRVGSDQAYDEYQLAERATGCMWTMRSGPSYGARLVALEPASCLGIHMRPTPKPATGATCSEEPEKASATP